LRGHHVRVVPATLAKALGVGARGIKTDRRDARALSEASCRLEELPSVHVPSQTSRARKTMLSMRDALVTSRTALINAVRGWMRTELARCRRGSTESFPKRVRDALADTVPPCIERSLLALEALNVQIFDADRELVQLAKADSVARLLMSVPGVGPQTAVAVAAALDDVTRFDSAHKVQAYLGLTPGERSSGDTKHRVGITKAGSARVRWLLIQAAWVTRRVAKTHPLCLWASDVEKRRGKFVAVVALARKLAGILFAIWRDGVPYDPKLGANGPAAPATVV
jgi:transposase